MIPVDHRGFIGTLNCLPGLNMALVQKGSLALTT